MKRNKFMEFLNSKGQYAAIFAFIVVAGICAGSVAYNKGINDVEKQQAQSSEPVLTNKNAETKKIEPELEKNSPKTVEKPQQSSNNSAEPKAEPKTEPKTENKAVPESQPQNGTAALSDDEDEDFEIAFGWPLEGDIVMGYSPTKLVYDSTLDQYRTNSSVCIAAETGTAVAAAADGIVAEVVNDDTKGNYVVIDHDNGWTTTYSQLTDIKVAVGDAVVKGGEIAAVAAPSIYSSAMGAHIEFSVALDDMTVDPEVAIG